MSFLCRAQAYYDSDVGLIEWGTVVTTAAVFVILLHLAIETKTWVSAFDDICLFRGWIC